MAIKIYETQVRPTTETGQVATTPGMRVSQATGAAIGRAIKGTAKEAIGLYAEIETRKSENEVLEKSQQILEGNENFEGLSMATQKAGMMDDPDSAIQYYNDAFEIAKNNVGLDFKHRYSKKLFDQYLKKQKIKDGLVVRKNSNAAFITKSQTLELSELEKLKKDIVYGETEDIKNLAKIELENKLNSDKFNNLFGANSEATKNSTLQDIEFYKAKRQIDINAVDGLEAAKKNKLINLENYEKLKTYAKTGNAKLKSSNTTNLNNIDSGLDDYVVPDLNAVLEAEKIAVQIGDETQINKINEIKKKAELLLNLKGMDMQEINQAATTANRLANQKGADQDLLFRLDYINKYKNNLETNLNKDPIETANKIGTFETNPLNVSDFLRDPYNIEEFSQNVAIRVQNAKAISDFYGTPLQFFTKSEKLAIKNAIDQTNDPKILINIANGIAASFKTDSDKVFKEISKDSKFLGYLGGLSVVNGINDNAVELAAFGFTLAKTDKLKKTFSPSDKNYLTTIKKFREAFPLTGQQETYDDIIEAATHIYNATMYKSNKDLSVFKNDVFKKSLQLASGQQGDYGGLENYQGKFIPIPNYVKNGNFSDVVDLLRNPEIFLKATGGDEPKHVDLAQGKLKKANIFKEGDPVFIGIGYGKYVLAMGDHPFDKNANPQFVASSKPNAKTGLSYLVVDLNKIKTEILGIN